MLLLYLRVRGIECQNLRPASAFRKPGKLRQNFLQYFQPAFSLRMSGFVTYTVHPATCVAQNMVDCGVVERFPWLREKRRRAHMFWITLWYRSSRYTCHLHLQQVLMPSIIFLVMDVEHMLLRMYHSVLRLDRVVANSRFIDLLSAKSYHVH